MNRKSAKYQAALDFLTSIPLTKAYAQRSAGPVPLDDSDSDTERSLASDGLPGALQLRTCCWWSWWKQP